MKKNLILLSLLIVSLLTHAQTDLNIKTIMQGEKFTGYSPENISWNITNDKIYFDWNPEIEQGRSLYGININTLNNIYKVENQEKENLIPLNGDWNKDKTLYTYSKKGDIYLYKKQSNDILRVSYTKQYERSPKFISNDTEIAYIESNNYYTWNIKTGIIQQITNFNNKNKTKKKKETKSWLEKQQEHLFLYIKQDKEYQNWQEKNKTKEKSKIKDIFINKKSVRNLNISKNKKYITYTLTEYPKQKNTIMPVYVNKNGYTETVKTRSKVGVYYPNQELYFYNIDNDTVIKISIEKIKGIKDFPEFIKHKENEIRDVHFSNLIWNEKSEYAIISMRSNDNKDRWIMLFEPNNKELKLIDRQTDEAWIGGPGINSYWETTNIGWIDEKTIWFQSEETAYSHLYTYDIKRNRKKALTSGKFEIQDVQLSSDKQHFYISSNKEHPGETNFYKLNIANQKMTKLTSLKGGNRCYLSPDEKNIAILHSTATQPWELYIQKNEENAKATKITNSQTEAFKKYNWKTPEFITFEAKDKAVVHARLYQPKNENKNNAAIIFVHGAGYLQNAHKWWSNYYREYMFHNFLVDNGYTVLDIDYRGSAGYGRDWRTGIYRHMGGKDLSDQVDGAKMLIEKYEIDSNKVGIYGGSYGGFITLMAMFTEPDVFAAGAALRSVTDWAHYNHGYTSNILNTPENDSIAYTQSSPIYFAEGLKGHLLMLHGMEDDNVHFQDIVRLSQRLIELGKDNWELAAFPKEPHGFKRPESWTDEYKRIFKLFESTIGKK